MRNARAAATHSLSRLVCDRLGLLEPDGRTIVGLAALLGYRPDLGVLIACTGDEAATSDALRRACELDLLVLEEREPPRYRFRHALTQAAIREALSESTKRALHARIAAALERSPDASEYVERLAHHWSSAGDPAKARFYNERAAEEARRLGSDGDAAAFCARAAVPEAGEASSRIPAP
jgi:predicted ATPase